MHNNFPKREKELRTRQVDTNPVDEVANIPNKEIRAVINDTKGDVQSPVLFGFVNCLKLNVRREPNAKAEIVTLISALTEVVIDMDASSDDFYKICTATGIEGFCMKEYITIKQ